MILITAGAYVGQELQSGFGKVPPCMLPVGNRPILEYQIEVLRAKFPSERLVLSLPAQFQPSAGHERTFAEHRIERVFVKEGLTLADSVLYAVNATADEGETLRILHGDTLIYDLPDGEDVISTSRTRTDYPWEIETASAEEEVVWSGYFAFSSTRQLQRCLALSGGSFTAAIRAYDVGRPLRRVPVERWLDVGHINTYFASREKFTTERSFNSIAIGDGCVTKSGEHERKIEAEIHWLRQVPRMVKLRTPQLLEAGEVAGKPYYVLEYLHLVPLNELFVHGRQPVIFWNAIFRHCDNFLAECRRALLALPAAERAQQEDLAQQSAEALRITKTGQRLEQFAKQRGFDLERGWQFNGQAAPSLGAIFREVAVLARQQPSIPGVMHGDFCFSNILYDSRADAIKAIDPRGLTLDGELSIYGEISYDIAKLSHSVIGLYDYIIAGLFTLQHDGAYGLEFSLHTDAWLETLQQAFLAKDFVEGQYPARDSLPQVVLLFLSMLPLHADNSHRQLALMANVFRLYSMLEKA